MNKPPTRHKKLTEREKMIIAAAAAGPICQVAKDYIRLGGYGTIPVRFSYLTLHNLHQRGFLEDDRGIYRASQAGRDAISVVVP